MPKRQGWLFLIFALIAFSFFIINNFGFQLGLDLKGGSKLTLQVNPIEESQNVTKEDIESVRTVLERRVNTLGVSESSLQTLGEDQLILELPDEQDPSKAANIVGKTALLEFRTQKRNTRENLSELQNLRFLLSNLIIDIRSKSLNDITEDQVQTYKEQINQLRIKIGLDKYYGDEDVLSMGVNTKNALSKKIADLFEPSSLTGKDLISASRKQEQNNMNWEVILRFTNEGGEKFADLTKDIAGSDRLLSIILDGESISEAGVGPKFKTSGITGGSATISGRFSAEEARELEVQLRGGALPLPVEIIEVTSIGPLLGKENIVRSLYASILGLSLVACFMVIKYRFAGLVSVISLILYGLINMAVCSLIPITLTLPGLAGFILSIGMAVDANILIFERLKDELAKSNTLIRSIDSAFAKANSSIVDGHFTTLISCIILFYFGSSFVRGFAATLGVGVIVSLFTSLSCTRTFLRFFTSYQRFRQLKYFISIKSYNF
tara:strand:+ start:12581 stop:14062 length:1482 start_codon:yes stop_codon:yes gene_type:complete